MQPSIRPKTGWITNCDLKQGSANQESGELIPAGSHWFRTELRSQDHKFEMGGSGTRESTEPEITLIRRSLI